MSDARTAKAPRAPHPWHWAALIAGNVALALGPWSVRLADSGAVSAGFWRLALAFPFLLALAYVNRERPFDAKPLVIGTVMFGGVFFALDLASWHIGIGMTRLGNATLFGNSGSLVLMVWGVIAMLRWPVRLEWAAIGAALTGAAILMGQSLEISTETLVGDLFALLAGFLYAFYLLSAQGARAHLGPFSVLVWAGIAGMPVLLTIAFALGEPVLPTNWMPLIVLAIGSQVIGQGLLVYALGHFPPLVIGLALLTQPAVAALSGYFAFGEVLLPLDLLGMALLASALVLAKLAEGTSTPRRAGDSEAK